MRMTPESNTVPAQGLLVIDVQEAMFGPGQ